MKTGRPNVVTAARYDNEAKMVSPPPFGGHSWHPMSFDPQTRLVYISAQEADWAVIANHALRLQPRVLEPRG